MRDLTQYQGAMAFWPEVEVLHGVREALEAIAGQHVLCVASNAGDSDALLMGLALERGDIRHYFQHLWTSRELGASKPAPKFFTGILQRLGLGAAACAFVGNDYARDIVPAWAAGMKAVWLNPGTEVTSAARADAVIGSMAELAETLARLEAA